MTIQYRILLVIFVVASLIILDVVSPKKHEKLSQFWQKVEFQFFYFRFICDKIFLGTYKILGAKSKVVIKNVCFGRDNVEIVPINPRWVIVCIDKYTGKPLIKPYSEIIYEKANEKFISRKTAYDFCKAVAKDDLIEFISIARYLLPLEVEDLKSRAVSSIYLKLHLKPSTQTIDSNEFIEEIPELPTETLVEFWKRLETQLFHPKNKKKKDEAFLSGFISSGRKTM